MSIKGFLVSLAAGAGLTAGLIAQAQTPAPPNTYNHYGDDQTDTTMCWSGQTKPSWAPANEPQCSSYGMGAAQVLPGTPSGCSKSVPLLRATGGSVGMSVTVNDQKTTVQCQ